MRLQSPSDSYPASSRKLKQVLRALQQPSQRLRATSLLDARDRYAAKRHALLSIMRGHQDFFLPTISSCRADRRGRRPGEVSTTGAPTGTTLPLNDAPVPGKTGAAQATSQPDNEQLQRANSSRCACALRLAACMQA